MPLSTVATNVANVTGVADMTRVYAALDIAAKEIWATIDFPGEQQRTRLLVYSEDTNANRFATTPYDVFQVRRIYAPALKLPVAYANETRDFDGWLDIQDICQIREVATTPLQRRITNATRLTVARKVTDTVAVDVTIGGRTDVAAFAQETVTIPANTLSAASVNRYTDIKKIEKTDVTTSDILITDANGTQLSELPNHLLSARYKMWELRPAEAAFTDVFMGTFDVLYKPFLPALDADFGYFPPEYELVLQWIAVSHLYMSQEDKIAQGKHYRNLATEVLNGIAPGASLGKTIKRPATWNPFITNTNGRI